MVIDPMLAIAMVMADINMMWALCLVVCNIISSLQVVSHPDS